jgi:outer membrane receptor protein involved in Fe transport
MVTPFPGSVLERADNEVTSGNTTLGLRHVPVTDLMLRASYGTGFLPPHVNQLVGRSSFFPGAFFYDPVRDEAPAGDIEIIDAGSDELDPERSETLSAGVVFTPRLMDGLRVSIDWYRIEKRDNFATPDFFEVLADEGRPGGTRFPGRVLRGAPDGDPSGVGPVIGLDTSLMNIAKAEVEGYDLSVDYHLATARYGSLDLFASGTITKHHLTQTFPESPVRENVGLVTSQGAAVGSGNYPLKFRSNVGLVWNYQQWTAGWTTRYLDSYQIDASRVFDSGGPANAILAQGNGGRIPSQTYHDLFLTWRAGSTAMDLIANTEWQLGVRNVFNTEPPLDVSNTNGYYSGFGDPRLASYYLSLKKGF